MEVPDDKTRYQTLPWPCCAYRLATKDNRLTDANREAYRELVRAGIMYSVTGFVSGPEAYFRFTDEGWERRDEWMESPREND